MAKVNSKGTGMGEPAKLAQKRVPWSDDRVQPFREMLLKWYDTNRRDLPWRRTRDPYAIWVSEIMLQQTRVTAVLEHYRRFLEFFPDVQMLAAARSSTVLAAWSGLGYYRRARAMHAAARQMVAQHGGNVPRTQPELQSLPGIGRYTAAAIASIAYGEPIAVVDGNVGRVLIRLLGQRRSSKEFWAVAQEILSPEQPGDFNQAMMELGATVCVPGEPSCRECPVYDWCATRSAGTAGKREVRQQRTVHYRLATRDDAVFLVKRSPRASLMPGMWELPEHGQANGDHAFKLRHAITVTDFTVGVTVGEVPAGIKGRWVRASQVTKLPLTGLAKKILRRANFI